MTPCHSEGGLQGCRAKHCLDLPPALSLDGRCRSSVELLGRLCGGGRLEGLFLGGLRVIAVVA